MLQDTDLLSIQEVRTKVERAYEAYLRFRSFTQDQVDAIVEAMAAAARAQARPLAEMAVEETGMGTVEGKLAKNLLCADLLPRHIRGMKTIGVIRTAREEGIIEIAEPVGVVAAILPTTNPTSTAIYKSVISLKSGNGVVLTPHPRAKRCTCATIDILLQAALRAGAPEGIIQCINHPTLEATNALMRHPRTGVILSTGGGGIVKAAYSSGKPAYGVGPGNVPVLIDESADVSDAVRKVVAGKSFDYGTVCSSEQTIVAVRSLREKILHELKAANAFLCTREQGEALARVLLTERLGVSPECVGQSPQKIARMAGFEAPANASILAVEIAGVGRQHPLSAEKLSPVLALHFVDSFGAAVDACETILHLNGLGHTCVIYSTDDARVLEYGRRMPAFRVLVNTPSPQGATGITTNVQPSMTLGCGAIAGNITSDNVGPQHLLNIKRIAYEVRSAEQAFSVPSAAVDRGTVVSAVERYLAARGIDVGSAAQPPSVAAQVVDRFLGARRAPAVAAASPTCACDVPAAAVAPPPPAPVEAPKPAPVPEIPISDFVCENDVRQAIRESRKIFIGPKSIVTPSARDLGAQYDVLVVAKRP
ncbi:MAG: aldehyde dehydrogenase family protein [Bryobacteraceae bacterium]|nr:aldehyde dehydrogenase family protein [Bryobacteraceae bacterium]